jgi:hypothetical protein
MHSRSRTNYSHKQGAHPEKVIVKHHRMKNGGATTHVLSIVALAVIVVRGEGRDGKRGDRRGARSASGKKISPGGA